MRIPNVEGLEDAHEALNASNITIPFLPANDANSINGTNDTDTTLPAAAEKAAADRSQPQSFGRAAAVLHAANGSAGTASLIDQSNGDQSGTNGRGPIEERAVVRPQKASGGCAKGQAFYVCQNGFTGCCSVDPCNPGSTCPDGKKEGEASSTRKDDASKTDRLKTETGSATRTTDATTTGIRTASPTGSLASTITRKMPLPTQTPAPDCPKANGQTYRDSFKIRYRIRCSSDNTFSSFDTIAVGTGGYDQCFSACSQTDNCAGFTFVGEDTGNCYLKSQMPNGTYEAKAGGNYISCAKLNPEESVDRPGSTESKMGGKSSTGTIVGAVVGGVAFLGLLLLLVALIAKRRRKRIDKRRATVTHVMHGPIETDMTARHPYQIVQQPGFGGQREGQYSPFSGAAQPGGQGHGTPQQQGYGGHQRQHSTSHDVFTPYGGNVYDPRTHTRQRSIYGAQTWPQPEPAVVATLPAMAYRAPAAADTAADKVPMLDGTLVSRTAGGERSPRFYEHLPEARCTSSQEPHPPPAASPVARLASPTTRDSPTLGRQSLFPPVSLSDSERKRQHLMSWNNYDADHAGQGTEAYEMEATMAPKSLPVSAKSPQGMSPDAGPGTSDGMFVVSPLSIRKGSGNGSMRE